MEKEYIVEFLKNNSDKYSIKEVDDVVFNEVNYYYREYELPEATAIVCGFPKAPYETPAVFRIAFNRSIKFMMEHGKKSFTATRTYDFLHNTVADLVLHNRDGFYRLWGKVMLRVRNAKPYDNSIVVFGLTDYEVQDYDRVLTNIKYMDGWKSVYNRVFGLRIYCDSTNEVFVELRSLLEFL